MLPAALGTALIALAPPASSADSYAERYAEILARHTYEVSATAGVEVDYRALLREPAASQWREILAGLDSAPPPAGRAEKLALWIDAYNILAIDTVLRHYPLESIRDVGSFFRPVWKHVAGRVAGSPVTLHQIEHEILRPMGDPRIHAAIVCASVSCPTLRRQPWTATRLDAQFDDTLRRWLADGEKGLRIDRARRTLYLSRIFDWFEGDFEPGGGVLAFVTPYLPPADRAWVEQNGETARRRHLPYDWSLNDLAGRAGAPDGASLDEEGTRPRGPEVALDRTHVDVLSRSQPLEAPPEGEIRAPAGG